MKKPKKLIVLTFPRILDDKVVKKIEKAVHKAIATGKPILLTGGMQLAVHELF